MAYFMKIKFDNPKMKQSEKADQLDYSSITLQRYRNDINLLPPYRIQPNITTKRTKKSSKTNIDNKSQREHDLKRPQMTSNDFAQPETNTKSNGRNKKVPKAGSPHGNVEIDDECSDKILHIINHHVELAMQIISNDKTMRNDVIKDLKDFNSQALTTQAKKGEELISLMPAIKKAFDLMVDDIVQLSAEKVSLIIKNHSYDLKWLGDSQAKLLEQIDHGKKLI